MAQAFDFAIVGAGMAGASLAAQLAPHGKVLVVEAEVAPGYHATGRSAAFWTESYGGARVYPLTAASGPFLRENGLLRPRGALTLALASEAAALDAFARDFSALGVRVERLQWADLAARIPALRADWCHGVFEPDCCDIDVAALHQLYLAQARRAGALILCRAGLARAHRTGTNWRLDTADGRNFSAGVLINAAGAWADMVARAAGARPLGIQPYRRTIAQLDMGRPVPDDLPLVLGFDGSFYFRPDAGRLWLSPHDETASDPCDAAPDELDVALAIARLAEVADWPVRRLEHKWAGLRSFAPDRLPVYGFDPEMSGFFWFAGQGGFGIQTAPAAAQLAGGLVLGSTGGEIDPAPYSPARFTL